MPAGTMKRRTVHSKSSSKSASIQSPRSSSQRHGQTLILTHPSSDRSSPVEFDDDKYSFDLPRIQEKAAEPLFDPSDLSHISAEFANMRPFDFQLPKYEFYKEDSVESWLDDDFCFTESTLEDLALSNSLVFADIATTICYARAGRPKVVDVSPPASVSGRHSASSSRSDAHPQYHSRTSSYATDSARSLSSKSSVSSDYDDEEEYDDDDEHTPGLSSTPHTPASMQSTRSKAYFSHLDTAVTARAVHVAKNYSNVTTPT